MDKKQPSKTPKIFNVPILTLLIVLTLTMIAGYTGYLIGARSTSAVFVDEVSPSISLSPSRPAGGCTRELKICPDGTQVGRTGPYCEFEPCPGEAAPNISATPIVPSGQTKGTCMTGGCSGQVCGEAAEVRDMITTCEYRPEFACIEYTRCERQANGKCDWTNNAAYSQCLTEKRSATSDLIY